MNKIKLLSTLLKLNFAMDKWNIANTTTVKLHMSTINDVRSEKIHFSNARITEKFDR